MPENSVEINAPGGDAVSSATAASVALPLATGASLTAVTLIVIVAGVVSWMAPPPAVEPVSRTANWKLATWPCALPAGWYRSLSASRSATEM